MAVLPPAPPATRGVPLVRHLTDHGDRTALLTGTEELTYRELADRVTDVADRLGPERRLVLLAGANTVDAVVGYLAALAAGHPVLLVPGDRPAAAGALIAAYDPDIVIRPTGTGLVIDERRPASAHQLHPDLALLLSTSGSTGAAKLVRLSHDNIQANAEAIAEYLDIRETDRAATTLPLHYCYGLSVLHSHLLRGAALILTDLSVADPTFWDLFQAHRGTAFAGVPYTFDLLDRIGFAQMRLPHLRYVTQAGGRLTPDRVTRYAALGRSAGWRLFVMYGQTEATARMAYLPPELAESHPQAIGVPVPGGAIRLDRLPEWPEPDTGELVYSGPNVMLGYAESPADLRLGRTVDELRTGDVAHRTANGLYELIGRRSRFAKILGLRIDPQQVEAALHQHGFAAACAAGNGELIVAVAVERGDPARVRASAAESSGLPPRAIRVCAVAELPRLATGKVDYPSIQRLPASDAPPATPPGVADAAALCRLYAELLGPAGVDEDSTFVSLGGDSLSYVEMSVRLERALGHLPAHWHTTPIRELARSAKRPTSWRHDLETSVALRASAIVCVVGSHIPNLFTIKGGAHLLLGVAGYNFARFHLTQREHRARLRGVWRGVGRIAVPSMVWITLALLLTADYGPANTVLLNSVLGPHDGRSEWHFWFIEALVYILVIAGAALAIPAVHRAVDRYPFALPLGLAALGLVTRYDLAGLRERGHVPSAVIVFWLFALGWAAARASTRGQRIAVTVAVLATVPGFFGEPYREGFIVAGMALLIWVPSLPSRASLNRVAAVLAGASLYIYLTHWQVYPRLADHPPLVAWAASLAVGIGYAAVVTRVPRWLALLKPNPRKGEPHAHSPYLARRGRRRGGAVEHRGLRGRGRARPVG